MEREILFRGKRIDNGEWIYGGFARDVPYMCRLSENDNGKVFIVTGFENYIVDSSTVCQYIGLKDRNGIKIFEGDVLKLTFSGAIGEIICNINYFFRINAFGKLRDISITDYNSKHIEVLGNIYDNPELIP